MQLPIQPTEITTYSNAEWTKLHLKPKSEWPAGPWTDEPDKIVWKTKAGLPGMIVRNGSGVLCGYAAVSEGHPAFDKGYDDVDVEVHGGLTYADFCGGHICHKPEPGEPDHVFWFGFDCAHYNDFEPARENITELTRMRAGRSPFAFLLGGITDTADEDYLPKYRDIIYVIGEVEKLAAQLVAVK